jgi:hypothetical protein
MSYQQDKRFVEQHGVDFNPRDNKYVLLDKLVKTRLKKMEINTGLAERTSTAPENWRDWASAIFPGRFSSEFTAEHIEFWEWLWQAAYNMKHGLYTQSVAVILPRGFGKSVMMAAAIVKLGCEGHAPFIRYISNTSPQAASLLKEGVLRDLQKANITRYYPYASEPKVNEITGRAEKYTSTEVSLFATTIQSGGIFESGMRGGRRGDERVSIYILDDFETQNDGAKVTAKKADVVTKVFIPSLKARNGIIMIAQNLIHENSIVNGLATNQLDFLSDIKIIGPTKTIEDFKYESRYHHVKGKNWLFITGGIPTWPDQYPLSECEKMLNRMGLDAFLTEQQNDVTSHIGAVYHGYFSQDNIDVNICPDPTKPIDLCYDDGFTNDPRVLLFIQQDEVGGEIIIFDEIVHHGKLAGDMVMAAYERLMRGWDLTDEMVLKIEAEGRLNDVYRVDEEINEGEVAMYEAAGLGHRLEKEADGKWYLTRYYHKNIYTVAVEIKNKRKEVDVAFGGGMAFRSLVGKDGEFETPNAFKTAFGLTHYPVNSKIREGIEKTRRNFKDEHGVRRIKVHPRCETFIKEHRSGYRTDLNGKPIDMDNHTADANRYYVQIFGF